VGKLHGAQYFFFSFRKIFKLFFFLFSISALCKKQKSMDLGQPIIYFQPIAFFIFFVLQTFKPI